MAIADLLWGIGSGVAKGAKAAGAVLEPLAKRTAEVVSGEAPQIDEEQRQQTEKATEAKAQQLESQLDMGRKYGTLTADQQKQYVDEITKLYSHPSQMGTLVSKLHKIVHPDGATYQTAPLADATPKGGTQAQDEKSRESALADALQMRQSATDEEIDRRAQEAAKYHKAAGKSPPTPGSQLPADAMGPDGQVIPSALRSAGQSFIEWNGAWYPAPKAKPLYKTIKGHLVLIDPLTGNPQRDLGPVAGVKVSTHQTPFLGDDQQMHLLTTTSVTTPQGETIEVEAPPPGSDGGQPAAPEAPKTTEAPKTPVKKVGAILPKTGAKPVTPSSGGVGPAIPSSHAWAQSKSPLFKSDVAAYTKANEDLTTRKEAYISAEKALSQPGGPTASSDQELIYSWVRANVQGAGRMTQAEFRQAASTGSLPLRAQSAWEHAKSGRLPQELEQMMLADIKRNYETSQQEVNDLRNKVSSGGPSSESGGTVENWVRGPDGKLVKQ